MSVGLANQILKVEEAIKKKVCIGHQVSIPKLIDELVGFSPNIVQQAIYNMVRNGDLKEMKGRKMVIREK